MQKPNGYDEAKAGGEYIPVELGGHYCTIKQVSEKQSSTGKDMVVVLFDFCQPDKQVGYFADAFANDTREEKKWPFAGSKYIMVNDYNDPKKTSKDFKSFCTCVEESNNYSIKWGIDTWAQQFKGKKIGVVYGEEEAEYEGEIRVRPAVRWFCNIKDVAKAAIPKIKKPRNRPATIAPAKPADDALMLDNSNMTIAEQNEWLMARFKEAAE